MQWIQAHATLQNAALLYAALTSIANFGRALSPNGSRTAAVFDKMLALLIDAHKFIGTGAHADAPAGGQ